MKQKRLVNLALEPCTPDVEFCAGVNLYVSNFDRFVTAREVKHFISQYACVLSVTIMNIHGKTMHDVHALCTMATLDDARAVKKYAHGVSCAFSKCIIVSKTPFSNAKTGGTTGILASGGVPQMAPLSAHARVSSRDSDGSKETITMASSEERPTTLYLVNLDTQVDEQCLYNDFKGFGTLVATKILRRNSLKKKTKSGFIQFENYEDALRVKELLTAHSYRGRDCAPRWAVRPLDASIKSGSRGSLWPGQEVIQIGSHQSDTSLLSTGISPYYLEQYPSEYCYHYGYRTVPQYPGYMLVPYPERVGGYGNSVGYYCNGVAYVCPPWYPYRYGPYEMMSPSQSVVASTYSTPPPSLRGPSRLDACAQT